jgi:crossover junction endodeoxyribonuclease RusA
MNSGQMITLTLPLGPSVNHYFARNGNRTYLPAKVKTYRQEVAEIVASAGHATLDGRLCMFATIHPRSRVRTDLDNRLKGLQDALTHAGLWLDDEQLDEVHLIRGEVIKGGRVVIVVTTRDTA